MFGAAWSKTALWSWSRDIRRFYFVYCNKHEKVAYWCRTDFWGISKGGPFLLRIKHCKIPLSPQRPDSGIEGYMCFMKICLCCTSCQSMTIVCSHRLRQVDIQHAGATAICMTIYLTCSFRILCMTIYLTCSFRILCMTIYLTCSFRILCMTIYLTCSFRFLCMTIYLTCSFRFLCMGAIMFLWS